MKRTIKSLLLGISAIAFASCLNEIPDYESNASRSINSDLTFYDSVAIENVSVTLPSGYIRGFDASAVDYYEQNVDGVGAVSWYDTDRTKGDFFEILKAHGVNTVRLRIWNDPSQKIQGDIPVGDNSLARTLKMAGRIKSSGLKLMIDFHYSDTWTDPGKQIVPKAWQSLDSADDVAEALKSYTKSVLSSLNAIGASPDYVQVGNEINNGILLHTGYNSNTDKGNGSFSYAGTGTTLVKYLSSGCSAVREVCPNAKIVIHVASSNNPATCLSTIKDVDFDIIGLSYYPSLNSHGTIQEMKSNIQTWKNSYSKPVVIAETAWYWNDNLTDSKVTAKLADGKTNLVNSSDSNYTDLTLDSSSSYIRGTLQNQVNVLRHIIEESVDSGASGFFTWGGEMHGNWEYGMFDWDGEALPSIGIFGISGS